MSVVRAPNSEPIPGYRLLEPLGRGGFGEVWKCEAPGGLLKAIKFVAGSVNVLYGDDCDAQRELKALQLIKSIRHPFLLAMDRVELIGDDLLIVMELADRNLHDLFREYRQASQPGIPRSELLAYLREAAEVLDLLNQEYGLQHLDIKPQNLFLVGRHVKVADFGLVNSLTEQGRRERPAASPLYAAAEIFHGKVSLFSDQYSLAVTYQELLTGSLPFQSKVVHELVQEHLHAEPELTLLPASDRPIVARALAKDPRQRFDSCGAFVEALVEAAPAEEQPVRGKPPTQTEIVAGEMSSTKVISDSSRPDLSRPAPLPSLPPEAKEEASEAAALSSGSTSLDLLSNYRFLDCISRAPTGEVWKVQGPTGPPRVVRYVAGFDPAAGDAALARWQELHHPTMMSAELLPCGPGRLTLLLDLFDDTLLERLRQCQQQGMPGIPRSKLLAGLFDVAKALDELYAAHQLRHLSLSPRGLVLKDGRVRMMDFGLTELFWVPAGHNPAELNTRYAAPELFEGRSSPSCDQYSLALIIVELLTGLHPFRNLNPRQMATPRLRGYPDLMLLPDADRAVLLRALHADPGRRYESNLALLEALSGIKQTLESCTAPSTHILPRPATGTPMVPTRSLREVLAPLVEAASGKVVVHEKRGLRYLELPGPVLEYQCCASMAPGTSGLRLETFREEWNARKVSAGADGIVFEVPAPAKLWQRCLGMVPVLLLRLRRIESRTPSTSRIDLLVQVRPTGCSKARAKELLNDLAPALLESLHKSLQVLPERRRSARLPLEMDVEVQPLAEDGAAGAPIPARIRDISWHGMGLSLPNRPHSKRLLIQVPQPTTPSVPLSGRIVHGQQGTDGRFTVGISFAKEGE